MSAIVVTVPDVFADAEPWDFELTLNEPNGSGALKLSGSRLYVAFKSLADGVAIGSCDTVRNDGSLIITNADDGRARFFLPSSGREWKAPVAAFGGLALATTVVGDLFRQPSGGAGAFRFVCRIEIRVLPSTGVPSAGSEPPCEPEPGDGCADPDLPDLATLFENGIV